MNQQQQQQQKPTSNSSEMYSPTIIALPLLPGESRPCIPQNNSTNNPSPCLSPPGTSFLHLQLLPHPLRRLQSPPSLSLWLFCHECSSTCFLIPPSALVIYTDCHFTATQEREVSLLQRRAARPLGATRGTV